MISRFIGEMVEKYGPWFFIVLTFVSGFILVSLPQKYRPKLGKASPFIIEGCLSVIARVGLMYLSVL